MVYEVEDEVDWSDGTLDPGPSFCPSIQADSGYINPTTHDDDGLDYLFEPQEQKQYQAPLGMTLPSCKQISQIMIYQLTLNRYSSSDSDTSSARSYRRSS
jgi:hypothetical protein